MAKDNGRNGASFADLESRVASLERQVAAIGAASSSRDSQVPGWERAVAIVKGDKLKPVFDEALKLREADRARARRRQQATRRSQGGGKTRAAK